MKRGNRKNLLRILCMLCALTLAVGLLAACGKGKEPSVTETKPTSGADNNRSDEPDSGSETEPETDEWGQVDYKDVVPKDLDYEDATVNILMRDKAATDPRRYAGVQDSHNTVAVMYGATKNYEMLSAVLELFAYKSYSNVRPELFNRVIKGQNLQDSQSGKVFDLIMNSTRWDFSDIYPTAVENVRNTLWRDQLKKAYDPNGGGTAPNVIGAIAGNKDKMDQALADLDQWLYSHYN